MSVVYVSALQAGKDCLAARTPQAGPPTYLPRVTTADGRIDWAAPAQTICNLVRAMTRPYSGAFGDADCQGRRMRLVVWDAVPFSHDIDFEGGVGVVVHELQGQPMITCGDGILLAKHFTLTAPPRSA